MANEQVNIPSLIVILVLSGLIVRYLFFSSPAGTSRTSSSSSNLAGAGTGQRSGADTSLRAREVAAERILQMFPQVDRRTVLWDLHRTGGSLTATTERILAGRLEAPPITFQPPPPPAGSSTSQQQPAQQKQPDKPAQPDLIARYKLQDKLAAAKPGENSDTESSTGSGMATPTGKSKAWSSNKDERQALLQKRRDQMILEARRKMEAKIAAEKATAGQGA